MKPLLLVAIFLFAAPAFAQDEPTVPDLVERIALSLVADGVMGENLDVPCEGSRDEKLCREFSERLSTLLAVDKKARSAPYADSRPAGHTSREAVAKEEAEKIEKLLPAVRDAKAREAIAEAARRLKVL